MNVDACTSLPITTAMSRLDLRIGVQPARAAAAEGRSTEIWCGQTRGRHTGIDHADRP